MPRVKDAEAKIDLLFRYRPRSDIHNKSDLARRLPSQGKHGMPVPCQAEYGNGDEPPRTKHVFRDGKPREGLSPQAFIKALKERDSLQFEQAATICELYSIDEKHFYDDNKLQFEAYLRQAPGLWRCFLQQPSEPEADWVLRLVDSSSQLLDLPPPGAARGLRPHGQPRVDAFAWGSQVRVQLSLNPAWSERAQAGRAHLLLLNTEPTLEPNQPGRIDCLCPSAYATLRQQPELSQVELRVPEAHWLDVDGPRGEQTLAALLTEQPLGEAIYAPLRAGVESVENLLNAVIPEIERGAFGGWALWKYVYNVI
jgi:hypothetical protein